MVRLPPGRHGRIQAPLFQKSVTMSFGHMYGFSLCRGRKKLAEAHRFFRASAGCGHPGTRVEMTSLRMLEYAGREKLRGDCVHRHASGQRVSSPQRARHPARMTGLFEAKRPHFSLASGQLAPNRRKLLRAVSAGVVDGPVETCGNREKRSIGVSEQAPDALTSRYSPERNRSFSPISPY